MLYRMLMDNVEVNYSYLSSLGVVDHVVLRSGHHSLQLFSVVFAIGFPVRCQAKTHIHVRHGTIVLFLCALSHGGIEYLKQINNQK